ncbi:MAG: DUF1573 domain-containing protein [Cytophagales bacterium]|nr:DUF1573 domain-containing protein [Cytophagales bacterium]MDW8385185.1 DUF1573 domain-containing protein [Flammeovirgaceae bacterium]
MHATFYTVLLIVFLASCQSKSKEQESLNDVAVDSSLLQKSNNTESATTSIEFAETEYFFGTIKQGDVIQHTFKFKNTGKIPLVISNITASCGCTTPEYTREPVPPGGEGEIKVEFNSAGKQGQQIRTVTITANTPEITHQLTLKGEVRVLDDVIGPRKDKLPQ